MKSRLRHPYSRFFGTLANQVRIDILVLLLRGEKNVTGICSALHLKQPTASKNLLRLEECGFVKARPNGKERHYSINRETISKVMTIMDSHMKKYCCRLKD